MLDSDRARRAILLTLVVALAVLVVAVPGSSGGDGSAFAATAITDDETGDTITSPSATPTKTQSPTLPEATPTRTDTPTPWETRETEWVSPSPDSTSTPPEGTPPPGETPTPPASTSTPPPATPDPSGGEVTVTNIECVANCDGVETGSIEVEGRMASFEEGAFVNVQLRNGNGGVDLSRAGATADTRLRVTVEMDADEGPFTPKTLVVIGDDANFVSKSGGDPATATVEFGLTRGAVNFDVKAREPGDWPDRHVTATMEARAVGIVNIADVGESAHRELDGVTMASNAQLFEPPRYTSPDDGEPKLQLSLAAPHFEPDGSTVNTGHFQAFLPDALLSEWGVSNPDRLTATAPSGGGTIDVSSVDGGVAVSLTDYHYSSGNVTVTTSEASGSGSPGSTARSIARTIDDGDGRVDTGDVLALIDYWSTQEPVPETGGERIGTGLLLELIDLWSSQEPI